MNGSAGRKAFSTISIGLKRNTGSRIRQANLRKRRKMEHWRDRARSSLLASRRRFKEKVESNKRLMAERRLAREKNNNPTFAPLEPKVLRKPYVCVSLVPPKPRYSSVEPKMRLYGLRLELLDKKLLPRSKKKKAI